jgi:hypothetical protein
VDTKLLKQGAFSWFELMTTDVAAAKQFYTQLFGWTTEEMPMETGSYNTITVDGEQVAGIIGTPPEAEGTPPMWSLYVTVDDVDATVKQAVELGGKIIVEPRDIPQAGRFSVIEDPQGAVFQIMSYNME